MTDLNVNPSDALAYKAVQAAIDQVFYGSANFSEPLSVHALISGGIHASEALALLNCIFGEYFRKLPKGLVEDLTELAPGSETRLSRRGGFVLINFMLTYVAAKETLGGHEGAATWIHSKNLSLGARPIDILDCPYGFQAVMLCLKRIHYGVYQ
ncbi:DUF2384 domain-containing protein [Pseudomonas aeruginosa]|uniref:antitoxin Xre/MbcA/ParS toxin-binding domain-containing protein n=1 Tax=Pseudomonas aeruginosa TaxID=287 RepID=UPI0018C63A53|nr:antitoxin Xre/MbcA/ParS toxin-binding domain-containing protein [Pseudomonas aeruginosa]EKV8017251.1 DUF2384 domain-containing protein [Pseudomonas aeruginosa]EKX2800888.1 DUF2384 domain-containing protein [Pseudomonas aeruginosa]MBG5800586.1 DUF2384 domain-containing protein [Pseudomonas aeruginosa]MBP8321616.1 DUF2384 domain-containing protein [Pseudomonas aeruginosa]MBP8351598.1 DUF2384 domain-containing protein [Pseudomonas aeruginosa]